MAKSRYKITKDKRNGYPEYKETIVEAIRWDEQNKPLAKVLNELVKKAGKDIIETSLDLTGQTPIPEAGVILELMDDLASKTPEELLNIVIKDISSDTYYPVSRVSATEVVVATVGSLIPSGLTRELLEAFAAIQEAANYREKLPDLRWPSTYLYVTNFSTLPTCYVCVEGKMLVCEGENKDTLLGLTISDSAPAQGANFINISWEDAQKLIGYVWRPF